MEADTGEINFSHFVLAFLTEYKYSSYIATKKPPIVHHPFMKNTQALEKTYRKIHKAISGLLSQTFSGPVNIPEAAEAESEVAS
jgi:hypothetical protein